MNIHAPAPMAIFAAKVDDKGVPEKDAKGRFVKGNLTGVTVMEKRQGWGTTVPEAWRNADWQYAAFTADGKPGARYEGTLSKGQMTGRGALRTADGATYDGDWVDGKQDGYGVYTATDGSRYEGEWQNDRAHGHGTRRDPDGEVFTGEWRQGCFTQGARAVAVGVALTDCAR